MKLGAGHPMGPFELFDYIGHDTMDLIMQVSNSSMDLVMQVSNDSMDLIMQVSNDSMDLSMQFRKLVSVVIICTSGMERKVPGGNPVYKKSHSAGKGPV